MGKEIAQKRIKTTQTVFDIIEALQEQGSIGVTALAKRLDMSKSTVHAHLVTLKQHGYVIEETDGYRLGLQFLTLGGHVRDTQMYRTLYTVGKPEIDELVAKTGERVQLMVEENGYGIYLYQAEGSRGVKTDSHTGARVPLYATAVGKAYLAYLPGERVQSILAEYDFDAHTEKTVTDREELLTTLEQIRDCGIAFDRGERVSGICCVAAPILHDNGNVLGAVSISVPASRSETDRFTEDFPQLISDAARIIGLNTTYS